MKQPMRKRGSNLVYVVMLVALLGILGSGYFLMVTYTARSAAAQRAVQQNWATAQSLRQAVGQSVTGGSNPAVDKLVSAAQSSFALYLDDLEAWGSQPPEVQHATPMPDYSDYVENSYASSGRTRLEEGEIAVSITYYPVQEGERTLGGELELELTLTAGSDGKDYALGMKFSPTMGEEAVDAGITPILGWKAARYYAVDETKGG